MNKKLLMLILWVSILLSGSMEMAYVGQTQHLSEYFDKSLSAIGQTVTIYSIAFAVMGPILLKQTKKFSERQVFIGGFVK